MTEIDLLYKIGHLCQEYDCHIEISPDGIMFVRHYGDFHGKTWGFKQAYSFFEIEKRYGKIENVLDDFDGKLEEELAKFMRRIQND
jgi:hypothetical protein